ncbi:MAG: rsmI [Chthonomonadales bacterium]|nr:rsmI [Chthonomonadales bacterium]
MVSVPIGDPDDITLRALRVLRNVSLIVAENARISRRLLAHHAIETEIVSLGPRRGTPALAAALSHLEAGRDVALIADSGTPTVVDPGLHLIQAAIQQDYRVTAVPGASACLAALVLSGLPATPFRFLGVPPRKRSERSLFFIDLCAHPSTSVLYESPRYLRATLLALSRCLEETRKIVVVCDLTHTNERIFRGTMKTVLTEFKDTAFLGAYTLVISGKPSSDNS